MPSEVVPNWRQRTRQGKGVGAVRAAVIGRMRVELRSGGGALAERTWRPHKWQLGSRGGEPFMRHESRPPLDESLRSLLGGERGGGGFGGALARSRAEAPRL
jgi:hypothetical protein